MIYLKVANAFELNCQFSTSSGYSCEAQKLTIEQPYTKITSVSGSQLSGLGNSDVKYLGINRQNTKFLPNNLAEYFPNLEKIYATNSHLEYIKQNDFLGLTQLTIVFFSGNPLKELPCGVFNTNLKLQELHFETNTLKKIGADIFKPLLNLKLAHFRENQCVQKDIDNIANLPELVSLIEKNCDSSCCDPEDAEKLIKLNEKLNELEEKHNQMVKNCTLNEDNLKLQIDDKEKIIIKNKADIKELEKNVNNITSINLNLKKDLSISKTEIVKINKMKDNLNKIIKDKETKFQKNVAAAKISEQKLKSTISIKDKSINDLQSNIQIIKETLRISQTNWTVRCTSDETLTNDCYTKKFATSVESSYDYSNLRTFYEYTNDIEFRIENSKITNLSYSLFKHYPFIKYFFVTASKLKTIKNGNFIDAHILLQLTITRNQIRNVEDSTFEGAANLELINLASNKIERISAKAFTYVKKLRELNLSKNEIKLLNRDILTNLPSLEVFHMENNALTVISWQLFRNNPKLARIYFNNNNLKYIRPQIFHNLTYLVYLNLLDNICISKEYKKLKFTNKMAQEVHQACSNVVASK